MSTEIATRVCKKCKETKIVCTDFYDYSKNVCSKCRNERSLKFQEKRKILTQSSYSWKENMNAFRNSIFRKWEKS